MHETNPFLIFATRLNSTGIRYMVTGSVAATIYGEPRFTNDVDFVAAPTESQLAVLAHAFPLSDFYLPPDDVLAAESGRSHRGHFNIIHHATGFKADVYLAGSDSLSKWGLDKARTIHITGTPVSVAPPEYVIVRKLEFYREGRSEKHLRDIRSIIEGLASDLDLEFIERIADERGLSDIWNSVKS